MSTAESTRFSSASLCVVGNINRDLKTAPLIAGDYLFRDGETSVPSIIESVGGGGANSASAAAALGARVAFCGKVGSDALGQALEQTLIQHGICPHLTKDALTSTGTSINLTYENGQRHFVSCLPSNEALAIEDLDLDTLAGFDHLYRADIWFSKAMLFNGGNAILFQAAREAGMAISIDLNWDPQWGRISTDESKARKEAVRALLSSVDLAHGNVRELCELADASQLVEALAQIEAWGAKAVAVHLGSEGGGYYSKGKLDVEPPCRPERRINTTGTGDVFSVCMMLMHAQVDLTVREKLKLANAIVADFIQGKRQFIPQLDAPDLSLRRSQAE